MRATHAVLGLAVITLMACGGRPEAAGGAAADSAGGMAGMAMSMPGVDMIPVMRAHLDSVAGAPPARMLAMMAAHQDLASRMMDAMGGDMRGMHMEPDPAWAALADSLRQDLADLPGLSGSALQGRMQAHIGRMRRILERHEGMMKM